MSAKDSSPDALDDALSGNWMPPTLRNKLDALNREEVVASLRPKPRIPRRLFMILAIEWRRFLKENARDPTTDELLAGLNNLLWNGYAEWDSAKGTVRWRDARGHWQRTQESTIKQSLLPDSGCGWRRKFRELTKY